MEQIIIGGVISFLATFLAIPIVLRVADEKKLYDLPDDERKLHKKPIASLGGIGIFIGFIISILLSSIVADKPEFSYFMAAVTLIFFIGLKDDLINLSAKTKFFAQLIISAILIFKGGLLINNMYGFLGIYELPQTISYFITFLALIVIINAFNLIDGVDGLAGSIGLICSSIFGIFFLLNNNIPYALLGFSLSAGLLAFLIYNFHPAKIFMGDTGSLLVGLVNAILAIKFIQTSNTNNFVEINCIPAIAFGILLLPLLDTLRVFTIRIFKRKSPFTPDRNHLHHLLLDSGLNHKQVTFTSILISLFFVISTYFFQFVGTTILILSQITLFFAMVYFVFNYTEKTKAIKLTKSLAINNSDDLETQRKNKIKFISIPGKSLVEQK